MGGTSRTAEQVIARLARRAKGLVTREELLAAGVTQRQLERRLKKGALIPELPGVYRAGHAAPSVEARYLAAVKACGRGAALAGRAAAFHWSLITGPAPPPEVVAPTERRVRGVITHRSRSLADSGLTIHRGIPITTVPRTLVDLAAVLELDDLARACHEAGVKHGTTPRQAKRALARRPNAPGARKLRLILDGGVQVTLSRLESRFLERVRERSLPLPQTNRIAGGRRVDCRWPEHRLTVELDGYRYHSSYRSWEQDRERERDARRRGDEFRRFTAKDVFEDPEYMWSELDRLLQAS